MGKYQKSLRVHLIYTICIVCIPIFIVMFLMTNLAISLIQNRIYEDSMEMLGMNMRLMDEELNKLSVYFKEENGAAREIEGFLSGSEIREYNSMMASFQELEEVILRFRYVDNMICYLPKTDRYICRFTEKSKDFILREEVREAMKQEPEAFYGNADAWENKKINDTNIMMCSWGNEDMILCAWTSYDSLLTLTQNWKGTDGSYYCITSKEGEAFTTLPSEMQDLEFSKEADSYYFLGKNKKYLVMGVDSQNSDIRMVKIISRRKLLGIFLVLRIMNVMIAIDFACILIPYLLKTLGRYIFHPIEQLEEGIARIENGDLSIQIPQNGTSMEMEHLIASFNNMVSQIEELKIQNYEEKVEKQKLMLDYMTIQIEPHFYLNALNLINTMAQMQDTELIQKMTENLSLYLRYIASSRNKTVTIRQELKHIRHYMNIMEIRFGECFHYEEKVDAELLDVQIPPLLIQTIVENSMKYAFDFYGDTRILVEIQKQAEEKKQDACVEEETKGVIIRVSDNGKGYEEEILKRFAKELPMEGSHIGLWNAKMRLKQLYPEKSAFVLSNAKPQGAVTTILIEKVLQD